MFTNQETTAYMNAAQIPNDETVIITEPKPITGAEALASIDQEISHQKETGTWGKIKAVYPFLNGSTANLK